MKNGYENLKNTAQFGLDLLKYYKNSDDDWLKSNALLNMLAIEDILDRSKMYCTSPEEVREIYKFLDEIREGISEIRDVDKEAFKKKVYENSERLKSQF
jgi:hypothetical protein